MRACLRWTFAAWVAWGGRAVFRTLLDGARRADPGPVLSTLGFPPVVATGRLAPDPAPLRAARAVLPHLNLHPTP